MTYLLIITALTVSIDSFVCGFSLSLYGGKKTPIILGIALTVFLMCCFTNYLTVFFLNKLSERTAGLGGLILVGIGLINLIKKNEEQKTNAHGTIKQSLCVGFAVGLDGAFANLSLSLMGINAFYVPLTIAVMHGIMITLGVLLSKTHLVRSFAKIEFVPSVILILLGAYKILGLFI